MQIPVVNAMHIEMQTDNVTFMLNIGDMLYLSIVFKKSTVLAVQVFCKRNAGTQFSNEGEILNYSPIT